MALHSRQLQTFATLKQLAKLYRCAQGYNQGLYPHVWYIIFHDFLSLLQWWWFCSWLPPPRHPPNTNNFFTPMYDTSFFMIFWAGHNGNSLVHDLHDFAWPFFMILHDYLTVEMYTLSFSSSRLHPSSCSVIGSVEDRSVLMTIHDIYFNTVCYFEQVL